MYLKSIIYGASDGIITNFNIISGATGLSMSPLSTFIIALTVLIADGLSMGISDFLSYKAEKEENPKTYTNEEPYKHGLVTFGSFVLFGLIPLSLYLIITKFFKDQIYSIMLVCMAVSFTILGALQSQFTGKLWYTTSAQLVGYGLLTSLVAFFVSNKLSNYLLNV